MSNICTFFINPILSTALIHIGVKPANTGYAFSLFGFSFTLCSPLAGSLNEKIETKKIFAVALVFQFISLLFIGPTLYFGNGLPDNIGIIYFGMFLLGAVAAFMYIPITTELINNYMSQVATQIKKENEGILNEQETQRVIEKKQSKIRGAVTDKSSTISNLIFCLGNLIGPILGGGFEDLDDYRETCDIMSIVIAIGAVFYIVLAFWPQIK